MSNGGTPWSDSPLHPFAEPDTAAVTAGESEADRCDECGEHPDHWKHNTPDPSLEGGTE